MAAPRQPLRYGFRTLRRLGASVSGAAIVASIGYVVTQLSFSVGSFGEQKITPQRWVWHTMGHALSRLSYDLPFLIHDPAHVPEAAIIYIDENAARELGQHGPLWDRSLHTRLLEKLAADGPRAVFFDIVFPHPWHEAGEDDAFAAAIKKNGRVFLSGAIESDPGVIGANGTRISSQRVIPPIPGLRAAAAGWGLIEFRPLDGDYGVRRISPGTDQKPSAPWTVAAKLGAPLENTPESWLQERWLNHYGPAGVFDSVGYERALSGDGVEPGFFKDRIVVVGGRSTLGSVSLGKDDFRNPYSLVGHAFSSGAEIHLTALMNLLKGEWLTRLDPSRELWIAILAGLLLGGGLPLLRPHIAVIAAGLAALATAIFACWLFAVHRVWFAWCVPAGVQAPLALVWAVGARYFLEERRRNALRKAFGHYLSQPIADRIADSDFNLEPGGSVEEVSVLFTDLEGFTPLTEELKNPELVTQLLLKYFAQTTAPILENEGMVVNFVGDAVTAVWGAPFAEPDHARKAARAAWRLHESAHIEVDGHKLRTRIGVHTGRALAGNIGSAERFDYAVVGDAVNFASRLEGLNKYFGTNVLISDDLREKLGAEFIARRLGEFRVVGKKDACVIHEFLGPASGAPLPDWCAIFEEGVEAFRAGDFEKAECAMQETLALRGGSDGPAQFYLGRIAPLKISPLPAGWDGIVDFARK